MASKAATDFLTKEVKISNNIVTFRLLSRQLSIHVAEAKRELELFYKVAKQNKEPVFATYILTGTAAFETNEGPAEQVPRHLILLANEEEIDATKIKFAQPPSQHIYSVSPVPLKDHSLLTSATDRVRQLDKQKGRAHASQMGMLLSEEAPWPQLGSSKPKRVGIEAKKDTPISNTIKGEAVTKLKASSSDVPPPTKNGARQNLLSFGTKKPTTGNKPKETSEATEKKTLATKSTIGKDRAEEDPVDRKISPQAVRPKEVPKPPSAASSRGTDLDSDEDDSEPAQGHSRPAIKRKKSRTTDEDDDDMELSKKPDTAGLQTMMDIDDDNVVNGRSTREATPEHVPSAREAAASAKAAKAEASKGVDRKDRISRKRIPKGKKRVMRTRRVKNAKGYMVTEDYSSYEDADPNDSEKDNDTDAQSETDYGDDIDVDPVAKPLNNQPKRHSESLPNTKLKKGKSNDASKPGQQKLANFFGKKQ
ncbi:DNA polymerase subunit Cdc27 [Rhizoctonia solani]|uniref:DNA polymerase delta subunit 3 n=1 Tax=Rhizoctonia solani TaxID=456999 RepID=A0A8H8NT24_9AGAM|nr:DNA polymerase subunit Cdc27 [Rhizoctonia solani]QRW18247.1 DNA polymerase subunit Cdc27 [Rhizoctonia solani]